ncbi:hypothetical protein [Calothrix sp. 336/3]|uniref:hypothetical protein n=1 Tax=Calothrix sp. 336/3 TaxID=1337936 RepID=UPI00118748EB
MSLIALVMAIAFFYIGLTTPHCILQLSVILLSLFCLASSTFFSGVPLMLLMALAFLFTLNKTRTFNQNN